MTLDEQINDLLRAGLNVLRDARMVEASVRDYNPSWNPFDAGYSSLARNARGVLPGRASSLADRRAGMGLSSYIDPAGGNTKNDIFDFVIRKAPTNLEQGFGNLVLKGGVLKRVARRGASREDQIENIMKVMQYTNSSVQLEKAVDSNRVTPKLSGNIPSYDYLRSQAENVHDLVHQPERLQRALENSLIIDIETSGLDDNASVWQIAMKSKEGGVEDIRIRSFKMDQGVYITDSNGTKRLVGFQEYMKMREGRQLPTDDIVTGFKKVLERIDQSDAIVGQNVSFDLYQLLNNMKKMRGLGDEEFDRLLDRVEDKMSGRRGRIIDTRQLMAAIAGDRIPTASPDPSGGVKTFSQENVALKTNLLDIMKKNMSDTEWADFSSRLKKYGLHDARVDILVTEGIARALFDTSQPLVALSDEASLKGHVVSDPTIRKVLEESSAIVPSATKLKFPNGKMTPLQALISGTSRFDEVYSFDRGNINSILRAGAIYDWRSVAGKAGMTEHRLAIENVKTGAMGFLDANFADEIELEGISARMANITGQSVRGATVQQFLRRSGAAFAGISKPERTITAMLSEGNTVGSEAQRRVTAATRGSAGGMYFQAFESGVDDAPWAQYRTTAINPEILSGYETRFNTRLGQMVGENGARIARLSTVPSTEGTPRVTAVIDAFDTDSDVRKFVRNLSSWRDELRAATDISDEDARMLKLLEGFGDDFSAFESALISQRKYGVQIGQFLGDNVEAAANLLDELFPGRDIETTKMGVVVEKLQAGAMRASAAIYDPASRAGKALQAESEGAFATMRALEKHLSNAMNASVAKVLGGREAGRLSKYVLDNPKLARRGSVAGIAVAAMGAFLRDKEQDERLNEPFEVTGYEGARDYEQYKASMGEVAAPGFQSMPVSTTDPLVLSGAVQYLHDTKTRSHQMGAQKYAHLYGL